MQNNNLWASLHQNGSYRTTELLVSSWWISTNEQQPYFHMHTFFAVCALIPDGAMARVAVDLFDALSTILARITTALTHVCTCKPVSCVANIAATLKWADTISTPGMQVAPILLAFVNIWREIHRKTRKTQNRAKQTMQNYCVTLLIDQFLTSRSNIVLSSFEEKGISYFKLHRWKLGYISFDSTQSGT